MENLIWANCIKQTTAIVAFASLAVIFETWWVSLFSVLFLSSVLPEPRIEKGATH